MKALIARILAFLAVVAAPAAASASIVWSNAPYEGDLK